MMDIAKVLQSADQYLKEVEFTNTVEALDFKFTFQKSPSQVKKYSACHGVENLAKACYRCVLEKLIYDKYSLELEKVDNFREKDRIKKGILLIQKQSSQTGQLIKKCYKQAMKQILTKKSVIIEFTLFLIFLSSYQVLLNFTKSSRDIEIFLMDCVLNEEENIPVWAFIITNVHLTNMNLTPEAYDCIKKKFLKAEKDDKNYLTFSQAFVKSNRNIKSNRFLKSTRSMKSMRSMRSIKDGKTSDSRIKKLTPRQSEMRFMEFSDKQNSFNQEITKIFDEILNDKKQINPLPKTTKKTTTMNKFFKAQSKLNLNQQNFNKVNGIKTKHKKNDSFRENKKRNYALIDNKIQNYLKNTIPIHSLSSKNILPKQTDIKKQNSLSLWKQRVEKIRNSNKYENIAFGLPSIDFLNEVSPEQYKIKKLKEKLEEENFIKEEQNIIMKLKSMKKIKRLKIINGVNDLIEIREPIQKRIVNEIVNHSKYSPEKPKKVVGSIALKRDFQIFLKKSKGMERMENSEIYRLQKVITGSSSKK